MIPYPELLRQVNALEELVRLKRREVRSLEVFAFAITIGVIAALAVLVVVYVKLGLFP